MTDAEKPLAELEADLRYARGEQHAAAWCEEGALDELAEARKRLRKADLEVERAEQALLEAKARNPVDAARQEGGEK
jgi:hypothetical protein